METASCRCRCSEPHGWLSRLSHSVQTWLIASRLALMTISAMPVQTEESSMFHGLLDLKFSNAYITSRGLIVEDDGLVFQPMILVFADLYDGTGALTDVTATVGVWNSIYSEESGSPSSTTSLPVSA